MKTLSIEESVGRPGFEQIRPTASKPVPGSGADIACESESGDIRVVYVMGAGRSGSTVLDTILGNHPAVFSTGEMVHIYRDEALHRANCSCGKPRDACGVWSEVRACWSELTGLKSMGQHQPLLRKFTRVSRLGLLQWFRLNPRNGSQQFQDCLAQTQATYQAIAAVTGRRVIVESSKNPLRARLLCLTPGLDVRLVHLVRDVRGVAWSRRKALEQSRDAGVPHDMRPTPITAAAVYWQVMNELSERVRSAFPERPAARIHYEEFVADPGRILADIGCIAGVDYSDVAAKLAAGEPFAPGHLYAGNRVRTGGPIRLRCDTEWTSRLTSSQQRLLWLLCGHRLRHYGYLRHGQVSTPDRMEADPSATDAAFRAA